MMSSPIILWFYQVWDRRCLTARSQPAGILIGHLEGITFIDTRGDGRHLISNGKDQVIKLWDIRKMSSNVNQYGYLTTPFSISLFFVLLYDGIHVMDHQIDNRSNRVTVGFLYDAANEDLAISTGITDGWSIQNVYDS